VILVNDNIVNTALKVRAAIAITNTPTHPLRRVPRSLCSVKGINILVVKPNVLSLGHTHERE
jgi:hypothetical protein